MARVEKKTNWRKLRFGRLFLLFVIFWICFGFARNTWDNHRLRQEIRALEKRMVVLELRREELEREIAQWRLPENVERVAREELGLVKPGEIMYILSEPLDSDVDQDVKKR